jgi:hypothetical protein
MLTPISSPQDSATDPRSLPATAVVLSCSAALVLTTYFLGATWLARPLLGLPVGLWFVAATYALWRRGWLDLFELTLPALPRAARKTPLETPAHRRFLPLRRVAFAAHSAVAELCRAAWNLEAVSRESLAARVSLALDHHPELAEPITIAHNVSAPLVQAIRDHDSVVPVLWTALDPSKPEPTRRTHDVTLCADPDQGARVTTAESPDRAATWHDWARPRPLAYPSVFPHQIDPAWLSLASLPDIDQQDPVIGAIIVAAAVTSRSPARLTLTDRLRGRIPLDGIDQPGLIDPGAFSARSMTRLAELLTAAHAHDIRPVHRMAASALSAYLVTPAARLSVGARRAIMERIAPFVADRPEAWLRLAALRFADLDDDAAILAIHRADPLVRAAAEELVLDQAPFIQSELSHGVYDPLALGRVAAGMCLIAAQHQYERLAFLKDDLIEDFSYSGWLVGRDPDTALLHRVFDELLRVRRAESRGLPARAPRAA